MFGRFLGVKGGVVTAIALKIPAYLNLTESIFFIRGHAGIKGEGCAGGSQGFITQAAIRSDRKIRFGHQIIFSDNDGGEHFIGVSVAITNL
ncbi:MAG: hypothetical protein ACD_28C00198G0001 [uncultured bacterium]|nr:MAG: hypothetical protein ACD_28C00198G0001 [uncultured bacterium]